MSEKVEIRVERYEELVKAETILHLLSDVFHKTGESYTALDTVKMILGAYSSVYVVVGGEEGKE